MTRYISSTDNLKLMMNMLKEKSRNIQFEAFHVFKVSEYFYTMIADIIITSAAGRMCVFTCFLLFVNKSTLENYEEFH